MSANRQELHYSLTDCATQPSVRWESCTRNLVMLGLILPTTVIAVLQMIQLTRFRGSLLSVQPLVLLFVLLQYCVAVLHYVWLEEEALYFVIIFLKLVYFLLITYDFAELAFCYNNKEKFLWILWISTGIFALTLLFALIASYFEIYPDSGNKCENPLRVVFGVLAFLLSLCLLISLVLIWMQQYPKFEDFLKQSQDLPTLGLLAVFLIDTMIFLVFEVWVYHTLSNQETCLHFFLSVDSTHQLLFSAMEFVHLVLPVWVLMFLFHDQLRKTRNARIRLFRNSDQLNDSAGSYSDATEDFYDSTEYFSPSQHRYSLINE